jgi:hypothetical protein
VLLGGASLGALRVLPSDDSAPDQAFNVVPAASSPGTAAPAETTTTPPTTAPATTTPPTTAAAAPSVTTRAPLSPLAPNPPTTSPPAPPTTSAPPTTRANRPPVARPDQARLNDGSATINALANDNDPDGRLDVNRFFIVSEPKSGHAQVDGDRINYFADSNFNNSDTLVYRIYDDRGGWAEATVTITD